ncbi:MAG: ABC transporter permease [Pleurocapsa minor GSE-CHR-MK-17-07R]|jgi:simple sugar transport system permease protein|nr:ABC transporter permease [Pleurocapsa minor GSE-CHR-MK 17-07R]
MAVAAPTINEAAPAGRKRIKITRTLVFSILFVAFGVWLILGAINTLTPETSTLLTFGAGTPDLPVPTQIITLISGIYYAAAGVICLIMAQQRLRTILLLIGGVLLIPVIIIIAAADASTNVTTLLSVSLRLSTPIVLGAMAGIWCERSGVSNIAIEGMMLTGACNGFVVFTILSPNLATGEAQLVGVIISILSGGLMSLLLAWLSITYKTNQIVAGTVINIMAVGITSFIRREVLFSSEAGRGTLAPWPIPVLSDMPVVGEIFFSGRPIFYMMFVLVIVTHVMLYFTRWGLRTRAVGENPRAADTLGVNVIRNRWINVFIGGMIAGLAGAWFSLETTGSFDDNMTSGRGFIALAAMIFGKWTPFGAFAGGILFGFSDAMGQRFQFLGVPIPPQFLQMVPYVITIIVLAGLVGRAQAPKADGVPYDKEGK